VEHHQTQNSKCFGYLNHHFVTRNKSIVLAKGNNMNIIKIISGGQTGADIAGVDAAIESNISYCGWLPKGRKCETGIVPNTYTEFQELAKGGYPKRTEQNVKDSDGTVIFSYGKLSTGSALTAKLCKQHKKPCLYVDLELNIDHLRLLQDWITEWDIKVLNVAGSRESKHQGIYNRVKNIMKSLLNP